MSKAEEVFREMFQQQREFLHKLEDERENYESENLRAIQHEIIEFERGFAWKPWKDGTDAKLKDHLDDIPEDEDPNRPLTEEEAEEYKKEELIDIWHFYAQECFEEDFLTAEQVADYWENYEEKVEPAFHAEVPDLMVASAMRGQVSRALEEKNEDNGSQMQQEWELLGMALIHVSKRYFDLDSLADTYLEKNESNHKRQEGEVEGREEYAK